MGRRQLSAPPFLVQEIVDEGFQFVKPGPALS
jgi:hypothetical protein